MALTQADRVSVARKIHRTVSDAADAIPAISAIASASAQQMDDDELLSVLDALPEWEPGVKRKAGAAVRHGGVAYRVKRNVSKNNAAEPGTEEGADYYLAVTLGDEGYEEWRQPADKSEAYWKGDVVTHDGQTWVSTKNNNMDEPGTSSRWEPYEETEGGEGVSE